MYISMYIDYYVYIMYCTGYVPMSLIPRGCTCLLLYVGQKAGFLGSAFFFGNFIGSFAWGWASDVFGRKPIMLLGLIFTIFTELLFGFSQNFGWAVSARFFWGLLNGNLGVAKTYISEVKNTSHHKMQYILCDIIIM